MALLLKCIWCSQYAPTNPCQPCQLRLAQSNLLEYGVLLRRCYNSLDWMVKRKKWREDEIRDNIDDGSMGEYSLELKEAIRLLEELKECFQKPEKDT